MPCTLILVCDDNGHWVVKDSTRSAQSLVNVLGDYSELHPCEEASTEMGEIVITWTPAP
jgi:hypothetical protein